MKISLRKNHAPDAQSVERACRLAQNDVNLRYDVAQGDNDVVRAIVERTGFFRPDEIDVAVELVGERLNRGPASGYHFVFAEFADEPVGYACYGPIACTIESFDLYWIAIDPRFQRHGVGRRLMAAVEAQIHAAAGRRIYIDTSGRDQYAATRAFYERCGFKPAARLADFYAPGDDRVIYVKQVIDEPK